MSPPLIGTPPNVPFEAQPSADDIAFFRENGFLAVARITTDAEVDWLAGVCQHLFDPSRAGEGRAPLDRSGVLRPEVAGKLTLCRRRQGVAASGVAAGSLTQRRFGRAQRCILRDASVTD